MSADYQTQAASHRMLTRVVDFSQNVLYIPVDQRAAKLQAVKVGSLKKFLPLGQYSADMIIFKV